MATSLTRFRPMLDQLESREVPAAKLSMFASLPGGMVDSFLIKGSNGADNVTITDGPAGMTFTGVKIPSVIIIPPGGPTIVRVKLGGGNDRLNYLVPAGANPFIRQIEYVGGPGRNSFTFDSAATGGTGVVLPVGSNLRIAYDGIQGRVKNFLTSFSTITSSAVSLDYTFGAGNDQAISTRFFANIDGDSTITHRVDLGGGSATVTRANPANTFDVWLGSPSIGATDVVGTRIDFSVLGGPRADRVGFTWGAMFGPSSIGGALSLPRITFHGNLGAGPDEFTYWAVGGANRTVGASTLQLLVHGGPGNDLLRAVDNSAGASTITMGTWSMFDIGFFGGGGKDRVQVWFADPINLAFQVGGTFRLRLDGGAGSDRVGASLKTAASPVGAGIYDVEVRGGSGNDRMGLAINDAFFCTYRGGAALLDGGLGTNTLDPAFPIPAANVRRVNV